MSRRFLSLYVLTLIVLTGGALRLWYASSQLHINRFEDERYSLQNVLKIFRTGNLGPESGYYPSPVFNAPQAWALHASEKIFEWTGRKAFDAVGDDGQLRPTGFFLTRAYQSLCGVLVLPFIFLAGRRLFSPRVGWLAALILAYVPWAVHSSGYNKPDALLMMGVCLAFHLSLRATETGKARDYVGAGLGIALAMSAKLTGGLTAVPLMVSTLFYLPTSERFKRIGLLAAAGVSSAAAFILVNPYWRAYLHFIRGLQRDYAGRTEASRWEMPKRVVEMHISDTLFGTVLGFLALAGFAFLLFKGLRSLKAKPADSEERLRRTMLAMFLSFPVAYTIAYAAQTSYFKANNFLPVVPFTGLALAFLLSTLWDALETRLAPSIRQPLAIAFSAALVFALAVPGFLYVNYSVVPTTYDIARHWLDRQLNPALARRVMRDKWQQPDLVWEGIRQLHKGLSAQPTSDLGKTSDEQLKLADAVVLRRDLPGRVERIENLSHGIASQAILTPEPRLFKARGPPLTVILAPWKRLAITTTATVTALGATGFVVEAPPEFSRDGYWSVFIWLPENLSTPLEPPRLHTTSDEGPGLELAWASRKGKGNLFVSPRFKVNEQQAPLRFLAKQPLGPGLAGIKVEVHQWAHNENIATSP